MRADEAAERARQAEMDREELFRSAVLPQPQRLEILPGVGHMAPLESPLEVVGAVLELVPARHAAGQAAA